MGRPARRVPIGRRSDPIGIVLAAALSTYGIALALGAVHTGHPHGGVGASVGVLAMTLPVLWARRAPLLAAAILGVAAPLNVLVFGSLVRCGATLPAVFYVAVCLGIPRWDRRAGLGILFLVGSLACQAVYDPKLGSDTLPVFLVIAAAFYGSGRLIGQRIEAVSTLRRHNAELVEQRKRSAALATAIERERMAGQLDLVLGQTLDHIVIVSTAGRESLVKRGDGTDQHVDWRKTFADIEESGRGALASMRAVLSGLHRDRPDDHMVPK